MTLRTATEQDMHNHLVAALADKLTSDGNYVTADHIGHPNGSPTAFASHVPDIYAFKGTERIIAEAETNQSISLTETYKQWKIFSLVPGTKFHIIVPKNSLQPAQNQANAWGISVDYWWWLDI